MTQNILIIMVYYNAMYLLLCINGSLCILLHKLKIQSAIDDEATPLLILNIILYLMPVKFSAIFQDEILNLLNNPSLF